MAFKEIVAFRPAPVTITTVGTYIAIITALLWIHLVPPQVAPPSELESWGVDLDQAWQDLRALTQEFRPYNSKQNDKVREYLLSRIDTILKNNRDGGYNGKVEVVDDMKSNVIFSGQTKSGLTVYFEGTNIMVHVHGTDSDLSPVLVNAHYDSVSTGYGATDDGVAVVSILQLIQAFTHPSRSGNGCIRRGLIALFNNGEEDYLNGARAFAIHPMSNLSHSFLNIEGAGAGGRATLFRSTDSEVTKWYGKSNRPFGTVVSGDGFKQGMIKSETDYKVFTENLGMRGLDVAFWQPRSRYHTEDDDVRHTSRESLWHMLGTSLQTLDAATSDTSLEFDQDGENPAGLGHNAVWFDLFGRIFTVFRLNTLFALTITLIIVPFFVMAFTVYFLLSYDKLYYVSNSPLLYGSPVRAKTIQGWRGMFRFPVAFVFATTAVIGLAFLLHKINPMIIYSSQYWVWAMFLAAWWSVSWFILHVVDESFRPTALARGYAFIQQWFLWWILLIFVAISIDRFDIASGYWILITYSGIFLSAWISLLELFGLPRKPRPDSQYTGRPGSYSSTGHSIIATSENVTPSEFEEDSDVTEETPLFRGANRPTTFGGYSRGIQHDDGSGSTGSGVDETDFSNEGVYGKEQYWSKDLPSWVWIIQFLLAVPLPLIITGPVALLMVSGMNQTGADGSSALTIYLILAIFTVFVLLPGVPFYQRITYHVTAFIFFIFAVSLIYNLLAFPFSREYRLKVYFQQSVELETGVNIASLVGYAGFVEKIVVDHIPSAHGKSIEVELDPVRLGLTRVSWEAEPPAVVPGLKMHRWVQFNITQLGDNEARFYIKGMSTRACKIQFDRPVHDVVVVGDAKELGKPVPKQGVKEVRLWSRSWDDGWTVKVKWSDYRTDTTPRSEESGLQGKIVCLWSDANNMKEEIPALWESEMFLPDWAVVSKLSDGLVEGWRAFTL